VTLADSVVAEIVRRTEGVSPAFIKELMRRSVQFHLERSGDGELSSQDVTSALDEMLVAGGWRSQSERQIGAVRLLPARSTCEAGDRVNMDVIRRALLLAQIFGCFMISLDIVRHFAVQLT